MHAGKITAGQERTASAHHIQYKANVVDTDILIKTLMSVHQEVVDVIYSICVERGIYCEVEQRWKYMPKSSQGLEKEMYDPFVDIATTVHNAVQGILKPQSQPDISLKDIQHGKGSNVQLVKGCWNALPDDSPKSWNEESADIRPDIEFAITSEEREQLATVVGGLVQEIVELSRQQAQLNSQTLLGPESQRKTTADLEKLNLKMKEHLAKLDEKMKRWWLQLHCVVELKRGDTPSERGEACIQTVTDMRYILREQLNRRFVFGLTLCFDKLNVWLCDRSGLLGTETAINIHEEPKGLIRVLAALSILTPDQLGWDTTMRLYMPVEDRFIYTYLDSFHLDHYNGSIYGTHWAIDMPARDARDGRETFITVRCISAIGAKDLDSRASIVWEAVKYDELPSPKKVYVLKQSWRPSTDPTQPTPPKAKTPIAKADPAASSVLNDYGEVRSEAEMYDHVEKAFSDPFNTVEASHDDRRYVGQIYSHEDVTIKGQIDTTWALIRRNLFADVSQPSVPTAGHKRAREDGYEIQIYEATITNDKVEILLSNDARFPVGRTHTRILFETFGWPIKYFLDLEELIRMFIHGVKGHRFLYLRPGIIHRDVSSGNLLICPSTVDGESTTGSLIDLDHAKAAPSFKTIYDELPDLSEELDEDDTLSNLPVEQRLLQLVWSRFSVVTPTPDIEDSSLPVHSYISSLIKPLRRRGKKRTFTCEEVGWDLPRPLRRPCFDNYVPRNVARTGTLPFVSGEILEQRRLRSPFTEATRVKTSFFHDAIHDIESFFWVLVYLCVTRAGPGGHRRPELLPHDPDESTRRLWHAIFCLFDGDLATLTVNKTFMLQDASALWDYVLPVLHPYFEGLKDLIVTWWQLMIRAYTYRLLENDTIHDRVLDLLEKALVTVQKNASGLPEHEFTHRERERRQTELARLRRPFGRVAPGPARPSTPPRTEDRSISAVGYSPGVVPHAGRAQSGVALKAFDEI